MYTYWLVIESCMRIFAWSCVHIFSLMEHLKCCGKMQPTSAQLYTSWDPLPLLSLSAAFIHMYVLICLRLLLKQTSKFHPPNPIPTPCAAFVVINITCGQTKGLQKNHTIKQRVCRKIIQSKGLQKNYIIKGLAENYSKGFRQIYTFNVS